METKITTSGGQTLVVISGRLDTTTVESFQEQIEPLMDEGIKDIVMDCGELTYISSSGMRLLLTLQKSVVTRKGKMVLKNLSDGIKSVFYMTGFTAIFKIE
ncbi:MAG: STAS domain-containing protein [Tannerellaceae bacterium]